MAINLMICVDAETVVKHNDGRPTSIHSPGGCNHHWAFMMTNAQNVSSGNGTADLALKVPTGETIRISSASISNQLDYAVFVYDFQHWKGSPVLDTAGMKNRTITRLGVVPDADQADHQPPRVTFENEQYFVEQIDINGSGQEWFYVSFVVYGPPNNGERPVLGYFRWDPSITAE